MSKRFIDKLVKATKESGSAFFTKKNGIKEQETIRKDNNQRKEQETSLKDRMTNAAKMINDTAMKNLKQKKRDFEELNKQKLDEAYDKLKEMGKNNWQSLKNNQFEKLNKLNLQDSSINKAVKEVKEKVEEGIKKLKDKVEQPKEIKLIQEKTEQSWFSSKMHILQAHLKTIKQMIEKQSKNVTGSRLNIFSNILEKMYWRVAFLLMLMVFSYGLGTSLPRQIRKMYQHSNRKDDDKGKKEIEGPGNPDQIANNLKAQ